MKALILILILMVISAAAIAHDKHYTKVLDNFRSNLKFNQMVLAYRSEYNEPCRVLVHLDNVPLVQNNLGECFITYTSNIYPA